MSLDVIVCSLLRLLRVESLQTDSLRMAHYCIEARRSSREAAILMVQGNVSLHGKKVGMAVCVATAF